MQAFLVCRSVKEDVFGDAHGPATVKEVPHCFVAQVHAAGLLRSRWLGLCKTTRPLDRVSLDGDVRVIFPDSRHWCILSGSHDCNRPAYNAIQSHRLSVLHLPGRRRTALVLMSTMFALHEKLYPAVLDPSKRSLLPSWTICLAPATAPRHFTRNALTSRTTRGTWQVGTCQVPLVVLEISAFLVKLQCKPGHRFASHLQITDTAAFWARQSLRRVRTLICDDNH
jgi:hypothetical protein